MPRDSTWPCVCMKNVPSMRFLPQGAGWQQLLIRLAGFKQERWRQTERKEEKKTERYYAKVRERQITWTVSVRVCVLERWREKCGCSEWNHQTARKVNKRMFSYCIPKTKMCAKYVGNLVFLVLLMEKKNKHLCVLCKLFSKICIVSYCNFNLSVKAYMA